jgi:hypothetical protein
MKYIKTFENRKYLKGGNIGNKYNHGDYVTLTTDDVNGYYIENSSNQVFQISQIEKPSVYMPIINYQLCYLNGDVFVWVREKDLQYATKDQIEKEKIKVEMEKDAETYNL